MITIYTGLPRQGKTLNMVYDIAPTLRYGRRIITNTPIWCWAKGKKIEAEFYPDPDEFKYYFLRAENCTLVVDESSIYFSSLHWNRIGDDFFMRFRQAGKKSADLVCTSQDWTDTVATLRKVVDRTMVCRKGHFLHLPPLSFHWDTWNKERGFFERKGFSIQTPMVYNMKCVTKGYFTSKATLAKNISQFILYSRTLYPAQYRYASQCYDHEYIIGQSATLKHSAVWTIANKGVTGKKGEFEKVKLIEKAKEAIKN